MAVSAADVVARASRLFRFVRTPAGEPYAIPVNNPARVALTLDQAASDLSAAFLGDVGDIPGQQTMTAALTALSSITRNAEVQEVYLRMARIDGVTYLDLARPGGEYVEIRPGKWAVRYPEQGDPPCPALFTRSATTNALPIPERGGHRGILADLLALSTEDDRFRIAWGWLVAQALPETARPMIYFLGSQGSGKTTRGLMLANVLEPQTEMGAVLKRSERENNPVAKANFILTADNMTKLSEDVSNWLCSLVTGHRVIERKLYTNAETIAYSLKRTGIFTGKIKPAGLESDAEERMIFLEFERMTVDRIRADDDLMADFRAAHPRILGAVLDDMAEVLRRLPTVDTRSTRGYRFVNFAKVFAALDDIDSPGYVDALVTEANDALAERVYDEPCLVAVLRVVATAGGEWSGTVADLLAAMRQYQPEDAGRATGPWWPSDARQLGTRLANMQHALSLAGLTFRHRKSNGRKLIVLSMNEDATREWSAPQSIADIEIIRGGAQ